MSDDRSSKVIFLDLERENEIGVGKSWSTDMTPEECILDISYASQGYVIGDKFSTTFFTIALW